MTSANEDPNRVASAKTDSEPSDESKKTSAEESKQNKGEVELNPHPSKALGELITGTDESNS